MKKISIQDFNQVEMDIYNRYISLFEKVQDHLLFYKYDPKELVVDSDKCLDHLYFFMSGKAKISLIHEDGKRSIVHFVGPEEFIGELTLIDVEQSPKDVTCLSECVCMAVGLDVAREFLLTDNHFMLIMSRYIGKKLLDRTWFHSKQQSFELRYRLAAYILLAENDGYYDERHTETAEFLGVSYRHLLQTLQVFKAEHLMKKTNKGYEINRNELYEIAKHLE